MTDNKEQIEILKQWWHSYGKIALYSFIAVVIIIVAWRAYNDRQTRIAEAASALYDELVLTIENKEEDREAKAKALIAKLNEEHKGSIYADYANLFDARLGVEKKDFEAAKQSLNKTIETTSIDIIEQVAKYRLVRILIMQKKYEEALKLLAQSRNGSMAGEFYALEGDIYLKQGKVMEARKSYQKAVETGAASRDPILQMKTNSLGKDEQGE